MNSRLLHLLLFMTINICCTERAYKSEKPNSILSEETSLKTIDRLYYTNAFEMESDEYVEACLMSLTPNNLNDSVLKCNIIMSEVQIFQNSEMAVFYNPFSAYVISKKNQESIEILGFSEKYLGGGLFNDQKVGAVFVGDNSALSFKMIVKDSTTYFAEKYSFKLEMDLEETVYFKEVEKVLWIFNSYQLFKLTNFEDEEGVKVENYYFAKNFSILVDASFKSQILVTDLDDQGERYINLKIFDLIAGRVIEEIPLTNFDNVISGGNVYYICNNEVVVFDVLNQCIRKINSKGVLTISSDVLNVAGITEGQIIWKNKDGYIKKNIFK